MRQWIAGVATVVLVALLAWVGLDWKPNGHANAGAAMPHPSPRLEGLEPAAVEPLDRVRVATEPAPEPATSTAGHEPMLAAVLAGRVLLDGGPSGEAIEMQLISSTALPSGESRSKLIADARGTFRMEGLPADWSGWIQLPVPWFLSVEPDGSSRSRTDAIDGPREDLVIDVVRLPALRGRLHRADGLSVAGLEFNLKLFDTGGGWTSSNAICDAEGSFVHPLGPPYEVTRVGFDVRAADGASLSVVLDRTDLGVDARYGDLDAGDLYLGLGFTAHLRVLDPELQALGGAAVRVLGSGSGRPIETDASGDAQVGISPAATGLRVLAVGFAIKELSRPTGPERITVVLQRTNRLRVTVVDSQGKVWAGGTLRLQAAGPLFLGGQSQLDSLLMRGGQKFDSHGNRGPNGPYALFVTKIDGSIELQSLEVDQPFVLTALDELLNVGAELACAGLDTEEQRELSMSLAPFAAALHGRCVDQDGTPLPDAEAWVSANGTSATTTPGSDAGFTGPQLFEPRLSVGAQLNGHVSAWLEDVDSAAGEVTLTLRPGRTLFVSLRDALGHDVQQGDLRARLPGGERSWSGDRRADGRFGFEPLPIEPLSLEFEWCGRLVRRDIDARTESVDFEVPAMSSLEVTAAPLEAAVSQYFALTARPLDAPQTDSVSRIGLSKLGQTVTWPLWPGRYELQVVTWRDDGRSMPTPEQPHGPAQVVTVEAGATTRVTLAP